MSRFLTKQAQALDPYVPGEQPKDREYIKLNTNENPYPPSKEVGLAIDAELEHLNLYPDPESTVLRDTLAEFYGLSSNQVFVGNGSDEVLAFAFPAFFSGGSVLFPNITYSFYPVFAGLFDTNYSEIPLKADFSIDAGDYCENKKIPAGILIPNPNAPTGRYLSLSELEKIISLNPGTLILVDEAYIDFGGESAVSLIRKYSNLLVVMTLSKSRSLAGLRVGFAMGDKELIDGLNRVKNSFNSYTIDRLAMVGAVASIKDDAYFQQTRQKIIKTREFVTKSLESMNFYVIPSLANFLFIRHPGKSAEVLFSALRGRGILVRYFKKPIIDQFLRVTIGTDEEMKLFLEVMGELID